MTAIVQYRMAGTSNGAWVYLDNEPYLDRGDHLDMGWAQCLPEALGGNAVVKVEKEWGMSCPGYIAVPADGTRWQGYVEVPAADAARLEAAVRAGHQVARQWEGRNYIEAREAILAAMREGWASPRAAEGHPTPWSCPEEYHGKMAWVYLTGRRAAMVPACRVCSRRLDSYGVPAPWMDRRA